MNPLADILPPMARKVLYAAVFLGLLVFAAINASDGDWSQTVLGLLTSLAPLLAASNTTVPKPETATFDGDGNERLDSYYDDQAEWEWDGSADLDEDDYDDVVQADGSLYRTQPPLYQPGSDADGFGGDAPPPARENGSQSV